MLEIKSTEIEFPNPRKMKSKNLTMNLKNQTLKTVPNLGNEFAEYRTKPEEIYNQVRKMLEMLSNTSDNQVQKIDEFQCQT